MARRPRPPGDDIVVLSPHLDDAALSLGATIAAWARAGARVRVVSVYANDPDTAAPAGRWDAVCGFASSDEAARARREEDRRACALLGAEPVWLPFGDDEHASPEPDVVRAAIAAAVGAPDVVLLPGWPLRHPDHLRLTRETLALPALAPRVGLYVEQPYATDHSIRRLARRDVRGARTRGDVAEAVVAADWSWRPAAPRLRHAAVKRAAIRCYRSQLAGLGPLLTTRILGVEAARGGEHVAWKM